MHGAEQSHLVFIAQYTKAPRAIEPGIGTRSKLDNLKIVIGWPGMPRWIPDVPQRGHSDRRRTPEDGLE